MVSWMMVRERGVGVEEVEGRFDGGGLRTDFEGVDGFGGDGG